MVQVSRMFANDFSVFSSTLWTEQQHLKLVPVKDQHLLNVAQTISHYIFYSQHNSKQAEDS